MNATIESLFGPPSEQIDVAAFIQSAAQVDSSHVELDSSESIAQDCSVADIRDKLFDAWNDPTLSAYLVKTHEHNMASLYSATKASRSKLKNDFTTLDGPSSQLKANLDAVKLASWKLTADSATFMRPSKNTDHNVLAEVKLTPEPCARLLDGLEAIITVSVYTKSTWSSGIVNRTSQHALLSSQTLADLMKAIPCASSEFLNENSTESHGIEPQQHASDGCFVCIENVVYGDGVEGQDYAQKLIEHLQTFSKGLPVVVKAATTIHETQLSTILLRINQPYWFLHKGNCEHFLVVDQIRIHHPSDLHSGYPLTLQVTPPLLDLCRACVKVPALLAISGDVRLGESPCLLCRSCWRHMGESSDTTVIVTRLPSYVPG